MTLKVLIDPINCKKEVKRAYLSWDDSTWKSNMYFMINYGEDKVASYFIIKTYFTYVNS